VRNQIISNNDNKPVIIKKKILDTKDSSFSLTWNDSLFTHTTDCELSVTFIKGISSYFYCIPNSQQALKNMENLLNTNVVTISSSEWKVYKNGRVFLIVLSYNARVKKYLFTFSLGG
jgi:hypothetical protein